jgi:hypothetical protein
VKFVKVNAESAPKVGSPADVPVGEGPATETEAKEEAKP